MTTANVTFYNDAVLKAAERHLLALQRGEWREAWQELTTTGFRSATSYPEFAQLLRTLPQLQRFVTAYLEESSFSLEDAYLRVELIDEQQEPLATVEYLLLYQGKQWSIHTFSATPGGASLQRDEGREKRRDSLRRRPYLEGS